jgi:hypothetical protein
MINGQYSASVSRLRLAAVLVVIALLVVVVIALGDNAWAALACGVLGGLLVSGILVWSVEG